MTEYNELKNNLTENILDYLLDPSVAGAFAGRRFYTYRIAGLCLDHDRGLNAQFVKIFK